MLGIIVIVLLIIATGFFVAAEFSIVSVRRTRLEQLIGEGNVAAGQVKYALDHLQRYLAAIQIGVTMASLGLGAMGEPVLGDIFRQALDNFLPEADSFITAHTLAIILTFLIVTLLEIVFGEIVPKILARQRPDRTALTVIRPLNFFVLIFSPFVWLVSAFSGGVLRLLGLHNEGEVPNVYSVEELEMLVVSSRKAGVLDQEEEVILRRVFDFGDLTARQVMLPRTEVVGVQADAPLQEVLHTMLGHHFSRFPVYEHDLDDIVGVLHVRDVFIWLAEASNLAAPQPPTDGATVGAPPDVTQQAPDGGFSVRKLMRPLTAVPETLDVDHLLTDMQESGTQIVLVVDEYGGTAGIVTMEDIVEEIVGEVRGEFEPANEQSSDFVTTSEGTIIDGLVSIDDVNDKLGLHIDTDVATIGGFVFELLGRKPELGDEVESGGAIFRVEELDNLRISKVRVMSHRTEPGATSPVEE